jgi:hypothetical protein
MLTGEVQPPEGTFRHQFLDSVFSDLFVELNISIVTASLNVSML